MLRDVNGTPPKTLKLFPVKSFINFSHQLKKYIFFLVISKNVKQPLVDIVQ